MLRAVVDLSCMRTLTRLGVKLGKCQAGVDLFWILMYEYINRKDLKAVLFQMHSEAHRETGCDEPWMIDDWKLVAQGFCAAQRLSGNQTIYSTTISNNHQQEWQYSIFISWTSKYYIHQFYINSNYITYKATDPLDCSLLQHIKLT